MKKLTMLVLLLVVVVFFGHATKIEKCEIEKYEVRYEGRGRQENKTETVWECGFLTPIFKIGDYYFTIDHGTVEQVPEMVQKQVVTPVDKINGKWVESETGRYLKIENYIEKKPVKRIIRLKMWRKIKHRVESGTIAVYRYDQELPNVTDSYYWLEFTEATYKAYTPKKHYFIEEQ